MNKAIARKEYKKKRAALTQKELKLKQDYLLIKFQEIALPHPQIVHAYLPKYACNEPDPGPLVEAMKIQNALLKVAYPKINPTDFSMQHFLQDDDMVLEKNQFGIFEPNSGTEISADTVDLVFVPLLAFDVLGNRVGYGMGYYDRFLASCRKDVITIGLSFFPPLHKLEDINSFDKKIDFCITPEFVYAF